MEYDDAVHPPPLPPPVPPYSQPGYGHLPPPPPPQRPGIWPNFLQSCFVAGCATIIAPVLLIGGFLLVIGYTVSNSLEDAVKNPFSQMAQNAGGNMKTRIVRAGSAGAGSIAIVTIQGTIAGNGSPLDGDGSMAFVADQLRSAAEDDSVKGVILQIDSPGGGLTASDHLHHQVGELRKTGKPVIAWAGSMMASGGYYVAVAADRIMASPTSTVGSIGVILQHFQVSELMEKLGVRVNPVTSGAHKDLASPFRDMTPEERKLLQDYVDISHRRFIDIVAKGRNMQADEVAALADGGIMGAAMALEKGLIDSVGYIEDAVALLESELGEKDMRVIGYRRVFSFAEMFSDAGSEAASAALKTVRDADASPRAMTVYTAPGAGNR